MIRLAGSRPGWALGFADEVWFSRLAQPALHAWAGARMWLRFVAGRPVSRVTCAFLRWVTRRLAAEGRRVLVLIWDNAPWHVSRAVRAWIKAHNRRAKARRGCRLLVCGLPSKSPWLNPIEPRWAHGKRAVIEPARKLTGAELKRRLCAYYDCPLLSPLEQKVP